MVFVFVLMNWQSSFVVSRNMRLYNFTFGYQVFSFWLINKILSKTLNKYLSAGLSSSRVSLRKIDLRVLIIYDFGHLYFIIVISPESLNLTRQITHYILSHFF